MFYKVVKPFTDRTDKHVYRENDVFPHNVKKAVSEVRVNELIERDHIALIAQVETQEVETFPKSLGGGYYLLSNGEKAKGKDKAIAAEAQLKVGE